MKVITFDQFAALPEGTIFSYFEPMVCEGLFRKGSTIYRDDELKQDPIDYFQCSLVPECINGEAPDIGPTESRWGIFDHDQQYAVFEPADIAVLRSLLPD